MEIDKAIRDCDDRRLKTKYNNAIYVIQRALSLYEYVFIRFISVKNLYIIYFLGI